MSVIRGPMATEAQGEIEIRRGASTALRWSEVTVNVFDGNGDEVDTATGTLTGKALKTGSGKAQDFEESIDFETDEWSWLPEMSTVQRFFFLVSGLNAGYSYQITINSWNP